MWSKCLNPSPVNMELDQTSRLQLPIFDRAIQLSLSFALLVGHLLGHFIEHTSEVYVHFSGVSFLQLLRILFSLIHCCNPSFHQFLWHQVKIINHFGICNLVVKTSILNFQKLRRKHCIYLLKLFICCLTLQSLCFYGLGLCTIQLFYFFLLAALLSSSFLQASFA